MNSIFYLYIFLFCTFTHIPFTEGNRNLTHTPKPLKPKIVNLENYSFDYSAHKAPLSYGTYGSAVELFHKTKLISSVKDRYGAMVLNRV